MHLSIPLLLLLLTARCTFAQLPPPSSNDDYFKGYGSNFNAATAILIVVIITGFFFLAFFSVYFRRCSRDRSSVVPALPGTVTASRRGVRRGLDPAVIETFPILTYSAVTKLKIGSQTLECAVCLNEFADDETLRMLPKCCHVFHPECIDTWLESHVTCPVCRDNLAESGSGSNESALSESGSGDDVAIDVDLGRMGRSHTTGHVAAREADRHRLVLPEHVLREVVAASEGLRRSASVAVFRSGGEGSSRRGFRGLSARWTSRVMTWRRGEVERGTGGDGSFKGGVLNCINGGGVSNVADGGACSNSADRV